MTDLPATPRSSWLAEAGIVAMIGIAIALTNWFNPGGMELGARMAFWIAGMLAAWVLFKLLANVGNAVARLLGIAQVWGQLITIPLMTVIISWTVLWLVGGRQAMFGESFAAIWPQTLAIAAVIFLIFFVIYSRQAGEDLAGEKPADTAGVVGIAATELHQRLPAGFPAIIALSVEDHYVRVHAAERSEMILMPLAEAVGLVPTDAGQQVHRSWWVARSSVVDARRSGRDFKLCLVDGTEAPVSRTKVQQLRDEGWLS